jgi:zinc transporter 9
MFFLGAGASIQHGLQALTSPGHAGDHGDVSHAAMVNISILTFSLVAESLSLGIAIRGVRRDAKGQGEGFWHYLRTTDDPFGVAVLMEDSAAVLGVLMALAAVVLAHWTGHAWWDAVGTLAIGVLLGGVACFLIAKNRSLLLSRSARPEDLRIVRDVLDTDDLVENVVQHRAIVTGVESYRITAEVDLDGAVLARRWMKDQDLVPIHKTLGSPEALASFLERYTEEITEYLGDEIDRIEAKIRDDLPKATDITIEVD